MSEESLVTNQVTDTADTTGNQAQAVKTYTQEEFDRHMAGLKSSLAKKYERQYADLGDIEELRQLKAQAEAKQLEDAKKRGEFERVLQEKAAKWEAELAKRDQVIKEYKVNSPLLSAAAKYRAVNAEQVKSLLAQNVRLNDQGDVEVLGENGTVRYTDTGQPLGVEDLVREFLDSNPHFVAAAPATTNTRSNVAQGQPGKLDITKLDMRNPEHRRAYADYRKTHGLA